MQLSFGEKRHSNLSKLYPSFTQGSTRLIQSLSSPSWFGLWI